MGPANFSVPDHETSALSTYNGAVGFTGSVTRYHEKSETDRDAKDSSVTLRHSCCLGSLCPVSLQKCQKNHAKKDALRSIFRPFCPNLTNLNHTDTATLFNTI
jgi:hypothetical protein